MNVHVTYAWEVIGSKPYTENLASFLLPFYCPVAAYPDGSHTGVERGVGEEPSGLSGVLWESNVISPEHLPCLVNIIAQAP